MGNMVAPGAREVDEAFINRANFLLGSQTSLQAHPPAAQIAEEGKISWQCHQLIRLCQVADLEPGGAHGGAEGFGFIASCNNAANHASASGRLRKLVR